MEAIMEESISLNIKPLISFYLHANIKYIKKKRIQEYKIYNFLCII